ncbi:MAG: hypothetical protein WCT04_22550 [Planctomycetota bacterium]
MFRYLQAAFLFSPTLGALGRLPVNLLFLAGVSILGFAHPAFFMLGLGVEVLYLFAMATNSRFQRVVNSQIDGDSFQESEERRKEMTQRLKPTSRARLIAQSQKCNRINEAYRDSQTAEVLVTENCKALDKLLCAYLALLLNRDKIESIGSEINVPALSRQIEALEADLAQPELADKIRSTKVATLDILRKRVENATSREGSLKETDSALARIEAQLELAFENAMMPESQYAINSDIEIASQLLDEKSFSELNDVLNEMDRTRNAGERVRTQ